MNIRTKMNFGQKYVLFQFHTRVKELFNLLILIELARKAN